MVGHSSSYKLPLETHFSQITCFNIRDKADGWVQAISNEHFLMHFQWNCIAELNYKGFCFACTAWTNMICLSDFLAMRIWMVCFFFRLCASYGPLNIEFKFLIIFWFTFLNISSALGYGAHI